MFKACPGVMTSVSAPGVELVQIEGGRHLLGGRPHLDTVVAWFEERSPG